MRSEEKAVALICFTGKGRKTLLRLMDGLESRGFRVLGFEKTACASGGETVAPVKESVGEWAGRFFLEASALIFVGACGIAVRSIAPFLQGKDRDPAVLAVDETGRYVIPLLSGHIGGANELAQKSAEILGAVPVITTATDLNQVFAVDLFARQNQLAVPDLKKAKGVSAALLSGGEVGFFSQLPVKGELPFGLVRGEKRDWNVFVTPWLSEVSAWEKEADGCQGNLFLIPRLAVLGLGCKRGVMAGEMALMAEKALDQSGLHPLCLAGAATIDRKRGEKGLLEFVSQAELQLSFYSAGELSGVPGEFYQSEFVKSTVGVSCVCERAAVAGCEKHFGPGGVFLASRRVAGQGVTAAVAVKRRELSF